MTNTMKKKAAAIAILLAMIGYILPFVITKAGSDPSNGAILPGAPKTLSMRITAYASVPEETDSNNG